MDWIFKKFAFLCILLAEFAMFSCEKKIVITHLGENNLRDYPIDIDSMYVSIPGLTGMGNFYLKDSVITFVDAINYKFYDMNLDGQLLDIYFGKGHGRNELEALMYAYPIENDSLNRGIIHDQNNLITVYDRKNKQLLYGKKLFYGKKLQCNSCDEKRTDFYPPELHKIQSFSDLGLSYYLETDSVLIVPVEMNYRLLNKDRINSRQHYDKVAILGRLNLATMELEDVFGKCPEIFKERPTPHWEGFNYVISDTLLYVNHMVDSLIYVYRYPDDLQYTIGYECRGIDRNYTITEDLHLSENFDNDIKHVGLNSGLVFCPENNTLCRTYVKSTATGASGIQIYRDNDLLVDIDMPSYFKLLGYRDSCYYGAKFIPVEDMDNTSVVLYRLHIKLE